RLQPARATRLRLRRFCHRTELGDDWLSVGAYLVAGSPVGRGAAVSASLHSRGHGAGSAYPSRRPRIPSHNRVRRRRCWRFPPVSPPFGGEGPVDKGRALPLARPHHRRVGPESPVAVGPKSLDKATGPTSARS